MTRWFVYVDVDYYPYGEWVEAETAEEASDIVRRAQSDGERGNWATVVVPAEYVLVFTGPAGRWRPEQMENEEQAAARECD